ncbi:MAG TPA: TonB-dependent receptor [Chitinophaga sp.]|uniref:TonB-dependent receptor n=1 Tax=Chitinophaga sp. TaxID=1869181 RepID=UPI002CB30558|nr:TonB-dependent receptor [Chitinophaga sp.]HVI49400.1 TonB-dependent receptor [Chitinophaga sp.]
MSLATKLLTGLLVLLLPLKVLGWDWQTRVTVVVKDQPLQVVCEILEKTYGIHFSYSRELVNLSRKVTITAYRQRLKNVLEEVFTPYDIRYTRVGDQLVLQTIVCSTRTISGYVQDAATGEKLPGATIYSPSLRQGTTTNQYGYFSFTSAKDTGAYLFSYVGYEPLLQHISGIGNRLVTINLPPAGSLQEVVISASDETKIQNQTQMSKIGLPLSMVQAMPKLLGEADVMRTLQALPGVSGSMDGAGGLHVRGGSPDQNLVLMDGSPVFNFSHFFGIYSLLNADLIKSTDLYKGAFPARFGGRLSSVVDVSLKDGDMKNYHGDAAIGMISAKINVEGPIKKDKTSFIISGRRSYPDLVYNAIFKSTPGSGSLYVYFYDVNAKVNHIFSPKDRIFFSFYKGEDNLRIKQSPTDSSSQSGMKVENSKFRIGWGNTIGAVRWNHIYGPKLFSNVTVNYSEYVFTSEIWLKSVTKRTGEITDQSGRYGSRMKDIGGKIDFDYRPTPRHGIRFGAALMGHHFRPGRSDYEDKNSPVKPLDTLNTSIDTRGLEMTVYAEDDWQVGRNFYANVGLHASGFVVDGRFYYSLQPRLGLRYMLPDNWALKGAYTHMNQYIHMLSNNGMPLPTDIWVPSTQRVAPMFSQQVAAGLAKTVKDMTYEFSLEGYFKSMSNMIEPTDPGLTNFELTKWDEQVTVGKGWSYGGEILLKKQKGKTTGWVGYTLAWSTRRFPGVNNGNIFPYKYDRRHDLEVILAHKLSKNWELSAAWHFATGTPLTLPVASYHSVNGASPWDPGGIDNGGIDRYGTRYNYRTQNVHRLDVGITYTKQKKWWRKSWNFSIYNVYNQSNPFFYYLKTDDEARQRYLSKVSIMPILPSITYSVKF